MCPGITILGDTGSMTSLPESSIGVNRRYWFRCKAWTAVLSEDVGKMR